jgi:hypothetical protein
MILMISINFEGAEMRDPRAERKESKRVGKEERMLRAACSISMGRERERQKTKNTK